VDVEILKPSTGYSAIERPVTTSQRGSGISSHQPSTGTQSPEFEGYTEPLSEGEDEDMNITPAKDEGERTGLSGTEYTEAVAYREKNLKQRKEEEGTEAPQINGGSNNGGLNVPLEGDEHDEHEEHEEGSSTGRRRRRHQKWPSFGSDVKSRTLSIDPLATSTAFDETLRTRLNETRQAQDGGQRKDHNGTEDEETGDLNNEPSDDDRIVVRDWRAPAGKRISVPVRIEPKVYFAAERTFLVSHSCFIFLSFFLTLWL
jgi:hypothetical protein